MGQDCEFFLNFLSLIISDLYGEYEEVPRVVDMGESSLNLPDLGESDRDEEPYEKFMAEESGIFRTFINRQSPIFSLVTKNIF